MRVLVVEDEPKLAEIMARVLREQHFDVDVAFDGSAGLEASLTGVYDVAVLDRMLPGMDGLEICRQMRAADVATPVLILSARREMPERVEGLDAGADDYLGKPFGFVELIARIRALARRKERPLVPDVLRSGGIELDQTAWLVTVDGAPVDLSPKEYALLELLLRNAGQVLTRDQILERVWGSDAEPEGNVVDLYIHYLRRKLDRGTGSPIETVRGAGYIIRRTTE